ncbi:alpha-amylase glycogen brancing enzyme [Cryptosporidium ubiquitum]|uniref:Alpha-amylase glycogen brancing enzyme n=1 Tax=Cryptosporidium ubiquitum TaxID=857276 RepID=A0A1J4MGE3_9CRYT|nr:alpha-amylase glycogen brancing enzyme [Cryptosporidium ubiquitum]OII73272.1 alpha-amylase glycogen brancing enzyme [Cryptosporidium ubiquitum]
MNEERKEKPEWVQIKYEELPEYIKKEERRMGAIFYQEFGICIIRLWVVHCKNAWLVNSVTNEKFLMENDDEVNIKRAIINNVELNDKYHFLLETSNGEQITRRDPYARFTDYETDSCYVVDILGNLKNSSAKYFKTQELNHLIIYELHVESYIQRYIDYFSVKTEAELKKNPSFFKQIADYGLKNIKDLNFNCLELMPVVEYCGEWGYNPRLLMSINSYLGSVEDFMYLVQKVHENDLLIIVDLVLHHGASRLNSLWNFDGYNHQGGIYFEGGGDTGWGAKFNFNKKEVQDMLYEACKVFFGEYGVDGIRFDSVHNMPNWLLKNITSKLKKEFPGRFLIAEVVPENPKYLKECGFDSCWIHSSYYDIISQFRNQKTQQEWNCGYSKSLIEGHNGFDSPGQCILTMLGNHDQIGNRCNGGVPFGDDRIGRYIVEQFGGRENWDARAYCRLLYSLSCISFGVPMVFMGTENLQGKWWSAKDKAYNYDWGLIKNNDQITQQMRKLVKDINLLKSKEKEVFASNYNNFSHFNVNLSYLIAIFLRKSKDQAFLCVVNMDKSEWLDNNYRVNISRDIIQTFGKALKQEFNSQSEEYGGWEGSYTNPKKKEIYYFQENSAENNVSYMLNVPKYSVTIYRFCKI